MTSWLGCRSCRSGRDSDARALLLDNVHGPLDVAVCDQIVTESHGNPLALLELPRTWNAAALAGGFGCAAAGGRQDRAELRAAPAAAPPTPSSWSWPRPPSPWATRCYSTGQPRPLISTWRRWPRWWMLGCSRWGRVEFAHPLVRSAAYRSAGAEDRYRVHRALADATDVEADPDRRAWHLAQATPGPGSRSRPSSSAQRVGPRLVVGSRPRQRSCSARSR